MNAQIAPNTLLLFLNDLNAYVSNLQKKEDDPPSEKPTQDLTVSNPKPKKKDDPDTLLISHVNFLTTYLSTTYAQDIETLSSLLTSQEISFKYVWALFRPRRIVFFNCPVTNQPRAGRVVGTEFQESAFGLSRSGNNGAWDVILESVGWNATGSGKGFGLSEVRVSIWGFEGTVRISSLACFPIEYHVGEEELRKKLILRGRKWRDLAGVHHRYYEGIAYHFKSTDYIKLTVRLFSFFFLRVLVDTD